MHKPITLPSNYAAIGRSWPGIRPTVILPDGTPYRVGVDVLTLQDSNPKLAKDRSAYTVGLTLAPAFAIATQARDAFGVRNTCVARGSCAIPCLATAGHGGITKHGRNPARDARQARTIAFVDPRTRDAFVSRVVIELERAQAYADWVGVDLAARLNVLSDLAYETIAPWIYERFPRARFYDYTKRVDRMARYLSGSTPSNLHLTFSRDSARNESACVDVLRAGGTVAVVFDTAKGRSLPAEYLGVPVIDGDPSDLRYHDPRGVVVGLRAKGRARSSQALRSGFVVSTQASRLLRVA